MKIAYFSTYTLEYGGGFEKYLIETAAHLAELPDVSVDVVTMDDAFMDRRTDAYSVFYMKKIDKKINRRESTEDVKHQLGKARYYKVHTFKEMRTKLQAYDVVYTKNELLEAFVIKFLLGYKRIPPVVFGGHTPLYYPNPQGFHAKLHNFLYASRGYRFMAAGVAKFHAINGAEADRYKHLFPAKPVSKVYNPFDVKLFKAKAKEFPYPGTLANAPVRILWAGRLTGQKGVRDLAAIIEQVNMALGDDQTKVAWDIVGDGEERAVVETLAAAQPNVTYLGHVEQKYMASLYQAHDVYLSTSKWEGYPYTLIELQAFGLEAFAYDIPGPADIFAEYKAGHIVQNIAEMTRALTACVQHRLKTKESVKGVASRQFEPNVIYKQTLDMLSADL